MQFYLEFCLIAIVSQVSATAITNDLITENAESALSDFILKVTRFFEQDDILFVCLSRCILSKDVTNPRIISNLNDQTPDELKFKLDIKLHNVVYIVFADDPNQLDEILEPRTKYQSLNVYHKIYVVTYRSDRVEWLFEKLWDLDFVHLSLILYEYRSSNVQLVYGSPFQEGSQCGRRIILHRANSPKVIIKPTDYKNCPCKIFILKYLIPFPFVMDFDSDTPGVYVKPFKTIAAHHKFNVTYMFLNESSRTYIYEKDVVANQLKTREWDGYIAESTPNFKGISNSSYTDFVHIDRRVVVVPDDRKISYKKILTYAFSTKVWITMIATSVVVTVVYIYFAKRLGIPSGPVEITMNIVHLTIWGTINIWPKSRPLSVLIFAYIVYVIHLSNIYQSRFTSILTVPIYETRINTMQDLIESDLPLYVHPYFYKQFINIENQSEFEKKLVSKSVESFLANNMSKMLEQLVSHENFSTVLLESNLKVYKKMPLRALSDSYFPAARAVYSLRKGLPLFEPINKAVQRLGEGGFIYKWIKDTSDKIQKQYIDDRDEKGPIALKVKHLGSAWIILVAGYTIGIVVFIIEHLMYYCYGRSG